MGFFPLLIISHCAFYTVFFVWCVSGLDHHLLISALLNRSKLAIQNCLLDFQPEVNKQQNFGKRQERVGRQKECAVRDFSVPWGIWCSRGKHRFKSKMSSFLNSCHFLREVTYFHWALAYHLWNGKNKI